MDEFTVKMVPRSSSRKYSVFKMHKDDDVVWTEAKMKRENENQPWQIKLGSGRSSRRFKAKMEGGVGDNASYFVFYKSHDKSNSYEVCPVEEWYNLSATQRYKTLTAEEAEQKFEQRHKMLNLASVMHSKRAGENGEEGGLASDSKDFRVSELDDWDDQSGDDDLSGDEEADEETKKARKKKNAKKTKDDPDDAPNEAKDDSDEGDFEQREVDYMSDSSSSSSLSDEDRDETDVKGIAEEEALRDLLSTDDEEEVDGTQQKTSKPGDKNLKGMDNRSDQEKNGSDDSSGSDDDDVDEDKLDNIYSKKIPSAQPTLVKQKIKQENDVSAFASNSGVANNTGPIASGSGSNGQVGQNRTGQPQAAVVKRRAPDVVQVAPQPPKRPCPSDSPANGQEKIVEDLIVKYLSRKPMTLKSLLKDIKSKLRRMGGATSEMDDDLVNTIASIIKRIQPEKNKINGTTYLQILS